MEWDLKGDKASAALESSQVAAAPAFWRGRRVLVTGANGFVGSWLVAALVAGGADVVGFIRDPRADGGLRRLELEPDITLVSGSVTDRSLLESTLRQHSIQNVFHLAAQALVGPARERPDDTFDSNVRGTWMVLEAARQARLEGVVVASSYTAYGVSDSLPYSETHPLLATATYEASKVCADIVARSFHDSLGLPVAVARCANIYGGGDMNRSRLVPEVVEAALAGRPPVLRSNGRHRRDFLYIGDAVAAYLVLGQYVARPATAGQPYNFGGGRAHRVIDVVRLILDLAGRADLEPVIEVPVRNGREIPSQYVDSSKAEQELGWRPQTELMEGLRRTIDWYATHRNERVMVTAK